MDDYYAARSKIIPPLPWPTFAPPFSADRQIDGMIATDMIPNEMKGRLHRRIAQLNILITTIIEIAEQSSPSPKEVMERFVAAAVASPFAAHFPKMELA